MNDFENKLIRGIHISRYLLSYYGVGGKKRLLRKWLRTLVINGSPLTEDEIMDIIRFDNGKLELEEQAKVFINTNF